MSSSRKSSSSGGASSSSAASRPLPAFLQNVVDILESSPADVAGWSRLGDSFVVRDVKRFSREQLSKHFKSALFSSFVRQLNFYGFHKLSDSKKVWEFKHECFIRNRPDLMINIKRKTSAEYHTAHKGEVSDLRQRVGEVTGELRRANANMAALAEFIKHTTTAPQRASMAVPSHVAEALAAVGIKVAESSGSSNWTLAGTGNASGAAKSKRGGSVSARATRAAGSSPVAGGSDHDDSFGEDSSMAEASEIAPRSPLASPSATDDSRKPPKRRRTAMDVDVDAGDDAGVDDDAGELGTADFDDLDLDGDSLDADLRALSAGMDMADPKHTAEKPAVVEMQDAVSLTQQQPAATDAVVRKPAPARLVSPATQPVTDTGSGSSNSSSATPMSSPATASRHFATASYGMEDIVNSFSNSLDFTGAGTSFNGGDETEFAWADNNEESALERTNGSVGLGSSGGRHGRSLHIRHPSGSFNLEKLGFASLASPALTPSLVGGSTPVGSGPQAPLSTTQLMAALAAVTN